MGEVAANRATSELSVQRSRVMATLFSIIERRTPADMTSVGGDAPVRHVILLLFRD